MASNINLEDHVTCPVCLDIFKDPRSLSCRHTICKSCINNLRRQNHVDCPKCRRGSRYSSIVKDFQVQSLVDAYIINCNKASAPPKFPCEICETQTFVSYCKQCKKLFCENCKESHRKIPTCTDHTFGFDSFRHDQPLTLHHSVEELEKIGIGSHKAQAHFSEYLQEMQKQAFIKIDKAESIALQQVRDHHYMLRQEVERQREVERGKYENYRKGLKDAAAKVQHKVKEFCAKFQDTEPPNVTADTVKEELEGAEQISKDVREIKDEYSLENLHRSISAVVKDGKYKSNGQTLYATKLSFIDVKLFQKGDFWKPNMCMASSNDTDEYQPPSSPGQARSSEERTPRRHRSQTPMPDSPFRRSRSRSITPRGIGSRTPRRSRSRTPVRSRRGRTRSPSRRRVILRHRQRRSRTRYRSRSPYRDNYRYHRRRSRSPYRRTYGNRYDYSPQWRSPSYSSDRSVSPVLRGSRDSRARDYRSNSRDSVRYSSPYSMRYSASNATPSPSASPSHYGESPIYDSSQRRSSSERSYEWVPRSPVGNSYSDNHNAGFSSDSDAY